MSHPEEPANQERTEDGTAIVGSNHPAPDTQRLQASDLADLQRVWAGPESGFDYQTDVSITHMPIGDRRSQPAPIWVSSETAGRYDFPAGDRADLRTLETIYQRMGMVANSSALTLPETAHLSVNEYTRYFAELTIPVDQIAVSGVASALFRRRISDALAGESGYFHDYQQSPGLPDGEYGRLPIIEPTFIRQADPEQTRAALAMLRSQDLVSARIQIQSSGRYSVEEVERLLATIDELMGLQNRIVAGQPTAFKATRTVDPLGIHEDEKTKRLVYTDSSGQPFYAVGE